MAREARPKGKYGIKMELGAWVGATSWRPIFKVLDFNLGVIEYHCFFVVEGEFVEHNRVFAFSTCHFGTQCEYNAGGKEKTK